VPSRRSLPRMPTPIDLAARVRREVERNALRTRNGIKPVAGVNRPGVGLTPKDVVWQRDRAQLWRYRNDRINWSPPIFLVASLVNRSYVLDLLPGNSFIEQLRDAGLRCLPARLGCSPTTAMPATRWRTTWTPTCRRPSRGRARSQVPGISTWSGTASAGCWCCCRRPITRGCRCAASRRWPPRPTSPRCPSPSFPASTSTQLWTIRATRPPR